MSISISHAICGIIGFLLGSAGAGGAVYGAKKHNRLSFILGVLFALSGVAVFCSSVLFKAAVEEELADALDDAEEEADEAEAEADEAEAEAEEAVEEAEEAEEEAAPAEEEAAPAEEEASQKEESEE